MKKRTVLKTLLNMVVIHIRVRHLLVDSKIVPNVGEIVSISLLIDDLLHRNPDKSTFGENVVIVWYKEKKKKNSPYKLPNEPLWIPIPLEWLDQDFDARTVGPKEYTKWLNGSQRKEK